MIAAKPEKKWVPVKLWHNGNEWFEFACMPHTIKNGKRMIHFYNGKIIGVATIRNLKS